ncbi:hypothetical protein MM716_32890, partial [Klebsiella pneumoniae]|nr:hypothetical protein [Klebsiella pneumoniae]
AVVFGAATDLPPYRKVSGFDTAKLAERNNARDQIGTPHPGLIGYNYQDVTCASGNCPELSYRTQFTFGNSSLAKKTNGGGLDIYEDKSRDNSPIYKLKDHPWLGVSFNLGTAKDGNTINKFDEKNSNNNLVYTTEGRDIS